MKNLLYFYNFVLLKIIFLIQFVNHGVFKNNFSRDRIELLKHKLNFYSYDLKKRKSLNINVEYRYRKEIKEKIFRVDINKFTGFHGYYTFHEDGPLLKSAIEIYQNPNIKVKDSHLYKFYENFQPKTYGEVYKLNPNNSIYNVSSFLDFKPWLNSFVDNKIIKKGIFGPGEINEVEHRLLRLKNLFKNIKDLGYVPSEKDIIKGYILLSKDDFRFLITSGHHRVSILKAINYFNPNKFKSVDVAFEEKRSNLKFIDQREIDNWPSVSNKFCSKEDALEIFNKFFYV